MVVISKIYTRTGDAGRTRLSDFSEAAKTDPRVECYGDVDEANSQLGVVLACGPAGAGGVDEPVAAVLRLLQNELFDLGADLSTPLHTDPEHPPLRVLESSVQRLERWCDEFNADLPVLRSFVLPAGTPAVAALHVARTVVRRAERRAWAAVEQFGIEPAEGAGGVGGVNPVAVRYLNRLSDLLFVLARHTSGAEHEVLWVPGADRIDPSVD